MTRKDYDPSGDAGDLVKSQERTDPYYRKRQQALVYLGDRYLLAEPVNRPRRLRKRELTETNS
jgi:hypothetical protein